MTSPIGQSGRGQTEAAGDMPADERITPDASSAASANSGPASEPRVPDAYRIVPDAGRTAPSISAPDDERIVSDDERVVPDDERVVPDDERVVPDDERVVPDDERVVPDDERVVPDDERVVPDDDQNVLDEDDVVSEGGSAAAASVAATGPPSQVTPGSAAARPSASEGTRPAGRWPEIQAMFVDDPRASVELAAGLMDDSIETLIASVKERQHALLSSWQPAGASTEELRGALRAYRTFWGQVDNFCQDA
jgi:hypothetical protein